MTTHVLARKWRPRDFSTLVGQTHVVQALRHALDTGRLHHAYVFTGTRGVGKTTLARILAKAVNCETAVTSNPCGVCQSCREVDQGRFVDLLEVDAATNTRVDEMRTLLENAMYAPTAGRYKVYVIDEVHMLSNSAFNAMLKTLEEPPPHILFILATTDPQKIPVTVLSRCLQFNLKQMVPAHIVEHLQYVLTAEAISFEPMALKLLAHAAQGSMRDALSLTDQAIAYSAGDLSVEAVRQMLGTVDQHYVIDIFDALANRDGAALLHIVADMNERSLPFSSALQDIASLSYQLSVAGLVPAVIDIQAAQMSNHDARHLQDLSQRLQTCELQLIYQIATHARAELSLAPDEATGFGMALLRMLAFVPQYPLPSNNVLIPVEQVPKSPVQNTSKIPVLDTAAKPSTEAPIEPTAADMHALPDFHQWPGIVQALPAVGLSRQCLQQSECLKAEYIEGCLHLMLRVPIKSFSENTVTQKVQPLLENYFNCPVKLSFEVGAAQHTAHAIESAGRVQLQKGAAASIESDPVIAALQKEMGATIVQGSIRPLNSAKF